MRAAAVVALVLATAGCHGEEPPLQTDAPVDAPVPFDDGNRCGPWGIGHLTQCNPLGAPGAQGCDPGQKCTWTTDVAEPICNNTVGCVADGTLELGEACDPAAAQGGGYTFDTCRSGLICFDGVCRDICGFDGSAGAACAPGFNCMQKQGLFANEGDDPVAGGCTESCDPLTQLTSAGVACPAGDGCYLLTTSFDTVASCAEAGTIGVGEPIVGGAFANSCVPGAQPRRRDQETMEVECGGLCRPTEVTSTTNMTSEGGVEPDSCQTRWGAAPPSDPTAGESCRYWWAREPFDGLTPFSNSVGWCFKHAAFQYDSDGDQVPDAPFPRCIDTTTGDVLPPLGNPPHNDAQYFWCAPRPPTFTGVLPPTVRYDMLK